MTWGEWNFTNKNEYNKFCTSFFVPYSNFHLFIRILLYLLFFLTWMCRDEFVCAILSLYLCKCVRKYFQQTWSIEKASFRDFSLVQFPCYRRLHDTRIFSSYLIVIVALAATPMPFCESQVPLKIIWMKTVKGERNLWNKNAFYKYLFVFLVYFAIRCIGAMSACFSVHNSSARTPVYKQK